VEAASGKAAVGLNLLKDVQKQAKLKGFGLIAKKAARESTT
jgi:hypothetical protein